MRIILVRHMPNIFYILFSVSLQRILALVGIVQVDKLVIRIDHLRVSIHLLVDGPCQTMEELIICFIVPPVVIECFCSIVRTIKCQVDKGNVRIKFLSKRSKPKTFPPFSEPRSVNNFGHGCTMITMVHDLLFAYFLASSMTCSCSSAHLRMISALLTCVPVTKTFLQSH